jgi:hypothetical protein
MKWIEIIKESEINKIKRVRRGGKEKIKNDLAVSGSVS